MGEASYYPTFPRGNYVGEMALLNSEPRSASVTATVASEVIKIDAVAFRELLGREAELKTTNRRKVSRQNS